ncbi:MAG: hypothetical protein IH586_20160 [Anaerolineaceae bacterium]|nr:hypothetical protein [Anaerolineaceae bacterium]
MKKMKVTRKPQSRQEYVLHPSRVRMVIIYAIFFTVAVAIGIIIRLVVNQGNASMGELFSDWATNLAIVIGGAVVFALLDYSRWTIRVVGGENVEGPSGALGTRALLPLKDIDWERSGRSLRSSLKIGNAIYTIGRQRILISPWFYEPGSFSEFLDRIGYGPEKR